MSSQVSKPGIPFTLLRSMQGQKRFEMSTSPHSSKDFVHMGWPVDSEKLVLLLDAIIWKGLNVDDITKFPILLEALQPVLIQD